MGFHGKKQDGLILKIQELLILVTNEHDFGWASFGIYHNPSGF